MMRLARPRPGLPLAGLMVALVLAACGPTSGEVSPGAPTQPAAPASAAPASSPAAVQTTAPSATPVAVSAPATAAADTACAAPAAPTTAQTEGPYYSEGAPESADLTTDAMPGTRLTLAGRVVDTDCVPLAGAKVEIWQADSAGVYDNEGYTLRGWVRTDAQGGYAIRTVVPGEYPGRTEHIHVRITPEGGSTLTTQLYFPGSTANDGDGIFSPDLVLAIDETGDELAGTFTFVVAG